MRKTVLAAGLLILAGCSGALTVTPPPERRECRPESFAALEDRGIPRSRIESVFNMKERELVRRTSDEEEERVVGHTNWVGLEGCSGAIVLEFGRHCGLRRAYATGNCQIPSPQD